MQYGFINSKKTHKDTPPMPCNAPQTEKPPFPLLSLFPTFANQTKKAD